MKKRKVYLNKISNFTVKSLPGKLSVVIIILIALFLIFHYLVTNNTFYPFFNYYSLNVCCYRDSCSYYNNINHYVIKFKMDIMLLWFSVIYLGVHSMKSMNKGLFKFSFIELFLFIISCYFIYSLLTGCISWASALPPLLFSIFVFYLLIWIIFFFTLKNSYEYDK